MSMKRKFEVIGIDEFEDVHAFASDDPDRARLAEERMRKSLENVKLIENFPRRGIG